MLLYYLLTDQYPYDIAASRELVMTDIRKAEPAPPSARHHSVPGAYDAVVLIISNK